MYREQIELLKEIQAYSFSAFDLSLYLNTHPNDQRALADYSRLMQESKGLERIYNTNYGPLMAEDNINQSTWKWIEEPWPWEIDYEK